MGRKINVEILLILVLFIVLALSFYYPIFLGKIPLNGNLLVVFWSPWKHLHWPGFPTGVPFKFMGVDEVREFYPLLDFTHNAFRLGFIPLWNPYNFSGYPHLANWASGVFYPLHFAMLFLNKIQTLIFLKLAAITLSGFFTYLYLRQLKLDRYAAFFGGVAFAFSATMLVWGAEIWQSVHSFLWLPLVFFGIEKIMSKGKFSYATLIALGVGASLMGGYLQPTIYLLAMSLVYFLFRIKNIHKRSFFYIVCGFILGLGFSAVHTLPAIEAFLLSPRSQIALTELNLSFLLPIFHAVTFFAPDIFGHVATQNWFIQGPGQYYEHMIYIGVVPIVLSFFSLFPRKTRRYAIFFLIAFFMTFLQTLNLPTSRLLYELNVPFLSTAIPIRIIFVTAFCLSVLSSFGLSWWLETSRNNLKKMVFALLPLFFVYGILGGWLILSFFQKIPINEFPPNWYVTSLRNLIVPVGVLLFTSFLLLLGVYLQNLKTYLYYFIVIIFLAHAFLFAQKYFVFTESQFFYPTHPVISYPKKHQELGRYFGYGDAYLANNFATVYKLYSPEGYDPVNVSRYNELLSSSNTGDFRGIASRSDALIPTADISPLEDTNTLRLRLLDLLGVKFVGYFVSETNRDKVKIRENGRFNLVWQENGFIIFENKKAFERAFLISKVMVANSKEEAIKAIYDPSIDLSQKAIVTEKIEIKEGDEAPIGSASITTYTPNRVVVEASTNVPQLLVLSDAYYPGWQAFVDGAPTPIYPAYHALRAVFLPEGEHEVVFEYKPSSFFWGSAVSLISLFTALCILFIDRLQLGKRRLWV